EVVGRSVRQVVGQVIGGTGDIDGVDVHVGCEPGGDLGGAAGQDVDHPAGDVGGGEYLGQGDGGQRAGLAGHHDHGVAADHGGRHHRDETEQAGVLRCEHRGDAGRLGQREVEVGARDRVGGP